MAAIAGSCTCHSRGPQWVCMILQQTRYVTESKCWQPHVWYIGILMNSALATTQKSPRDGCRNPQHWLALRLLNLVHWHFQSLPGWGVCWDVMLATLDIMWAERFLWRTAAPLRRQIVQSLAQARLSIFFKTCNVAALLVPLPAVWMQLWSTCAGGPGKGLGRTCMGGC